MDYEDYDRQPGTFSMVCRLMVMFAMGYASGFYFGLWGLLVTIPLSLIISALWLRYIDGMTA